MSGGSNAARRRGPRIGGAAGLALAVGLAAGAAAGSPISDKYASLGGAKGSLGPPTGPESPCPDGVGRYRHYANGSIYWSPKTAAHQVGGLIEQLWARLGWEQSYLRYPMTDEEDMYDAAGRVSKFQGGELIWRRATNAVSEVKSTDLVVDLPTPVGEPWWIIQANGVSPTDSHGGPWAYCWDLDWNQNQPATKGRTFIAGATGKLVWVGEGAHDTATMTAPLANVISQKLGEGRYLSYMHLLQGSWTATFARGQVFLPQTLPWADRDVARDGEAMAKTGDVGAAPGAWHVHYCVTTAPDRPRFGPFESVPVAFRNYSVSDDGSHWTYVAVGVPLQGQFVRREAGKGGGPAPQVNEGAQVLNYGTVAGEIRLAGGGALDPGGQLTVTLTSKWGEPLASRKIDVHAGDAAGPWRYSLRAPDYPGSKITAQYSRPPPQTLIHGASGAFDVTAAATTTQDVKLKSTAVPIIK